MKHESVYRPGLQKYTGTSLAHRADLSIAGGEDSTPLLDMLFPFNAEGLEQWASDQQTIANNCCTNAAMSNQISNPGIDANPRNLTEVYWNGGNGSWSTASHWSNDKAPDASSETNINIGGVYTITVTQHSAAHDLTMRNYGTTLTVTSAFTLVDRIYCGTGLVSVSTGGSFNIGTYIFVGSNSSGASSTGTLSISAGGTVASGGQYNIFGNVANSDGIGLVNGKAALLSTAGDIVVGNAGNGTVTVSNEGSINAIGGFFIGSVSGGAGVLNILAGGVVSSAAGASQSIGSAAGASGTAIIDGAGSSWAASAFSEIGDYGKGNLTVSNNGSVSVAGFNVGNQATAAGAVLIESGGTLTSTGQYDSVGNLAGSVGNVTVTGTSSLLACTGQLTIGYQAGIVNEQESTMNVEAGATLTTGGPYDTIGSQVNSSGSVTVTGAGSAWKSAGAITAGGDGDGTLEISTGGSVSAAQGITIGAASDGTGGVIISSGTLTTDGPYNEIANTTGSSGSLLVTGIGASLVAASAVVVGTEGFGVMTISGGASVFAAGIGDGYGGSGEVTVSSGGQLNTSSDQTQIGNLAGSIGTITITGQGSSWIDHGGIAVSNTGTGTLIVSDGGNVNADLYIAVGGVSGGIGCVNVLAGSTISISGTYQGIGAASGAAGTAIVDGEGASWTGSALLEIGDFGTGSLTVSENGSVSVGGFNVANQATAIGALLVESGGTLTSSGQYNIVGDLAGSVGNVTLTGTNSLLACAGQLIVGNGSQGNDMLTNSVNIEAGGTLTTGGPNDTLGAQADSSGSVAVIGDGSEWIAQGNVTVGDDGNGTLTISSGGSMAVASGITVGAGATSEGLVAVSAGGTLITTLTTPNSYQSLGNAAGATGWATVDGVGSNWSVIGTILIGESGHGTIVVSGGGSFSADSFGVGVFAGGYGLLEATGSDSKLTLGGGAVGYLGSGTLEVLAGASAADGGNLLIGYAAGSSGTAVVDGSSAGTDSILSVGGALNVGAASDVTGELTISNDASVIVTGTITDFVDSTIVLAGGSLTTASTLTVAAGANLTGAGQVTGPIMDDGTITATGGNLLLANGFNALTGTGDLIADSGSSISLTAGVALTELINGDGALDLGGIFSYTVSGIEDITIADVTVASVSTLSGSGTIGSSIINLGNIAASGGMLTISGDVANRGTLQAQVGQVLSLTGDDTLAGSILGAGTIFLTGADTIGSARITASYLTIGSEGSLSGTGAITSSIANAGVLQASGSLTLLGLMTDSGTLRAATGAVLDLAGGGSVSGIVTGTGTLRLDGKARYALTSSATLDVNQLVIDLNTILSGTGTIASAVTNIGTIAATGGKLVISGPIAGAGVLQAAASSILDLTAGGSLNEAVSGAGTLELGGAFLLGTGAPTVASLAIDAGASLSGAGTLTNVMADAGTINASTGTLTLKGALSGAGTLSAASGAVLDYLGSGSFGGILAGAGTVEIGTALALNGSVAFDAATMIDTANLTLAASTTLTEAAGSTLDITAAITKTKLTLAGPASSSFTNAGNVVANGLGTASVSMAVINSGNIAANSGTLAFLGAVTNTGTIDASAGVLSIKTAVGGTGTLEVGAAGTLSLLLGAGTGQTMDFLANTGLLDLTKPTDFKGIIDGFGGSDKIDLLKTPETSFGFSNGVLTVKDGTKTEASLHVGGSYTQSDFSLTSDGHGGTMITFV